ncbi:flagellar hook-length control protein FliK [Geobacter sp. SVR]|uniref:flagellar hook-length control protein FliK n=1 Tax=Geobacter sp. SVR TaxID=2495594 RepID=UPI00143EFA79|nr:flagellar hook-length control protein FliK [Geobacter sp. SVR]BCS55822.1 hypothetical protein GSVR_41300 [Geobacter sp. SVR]GCF83826.1 hypothetical protein GSbR_04260 [Geobacter sp. SVR]
MNTGQIVADLALGVTVPAATTAPSPALEGAASVFAGMLKEMAPGLSHSFPIAAGATKAVSPAVTAEDVAGQPALPVDPSGEVLMSLLSDVQPDGGGKSVQHTEPVMDMKVEEPKKTEADIWEPQNLAESAAGAMLTSQLNGRMPDLNTLQPSREEDAEKGSEVAVVSVQSAAKTGAVFPTGPQTTQLTAQLVTPEQVAVHVDSPPSVVPGTTSEQSMSRVSVPVPDHPEVPVDVTLHSDPAIPLETRQMQSAAIPVKAAATQDMPVAAATTPARAESSRSSEAKTADGSDGTKEVADVTAAKTATVTIDAVQATTPGKSVSQQVPPRMDVAEMVVAENTSVLPDGSAREEVGPAKRVLPVQPSGFRFSRSAAVEVALGNGQEVNVRTPEKSAGQNKIVTETVQQLEKEVSSSFKGSTSDSMEQGAPGFTQQSPEVPHTVLPHTVVGHQSVSVDAASSSTLQAEQVHVNVREDIAGQVRDRLGTHELKSGSEQVVLKLSPEQLGDVKVHLRLEDQHLRVEIVAENKMARESLLQHVDSLKESLSRQNITMDKFSVTSGGSEAGSQHGGTQGDWRELARNRQAQQWLASGGYRIPTAEIASAQPVYFARTDQSMLDLHF